MSDSAANTGSRPWKSILSVLAVTKFSDWLASKAAPEDRPDGTVARPTLTARVLQAATQAGGAAVVTAVLSQARNRDRRLSAIRTAISPPGQVPPSVESGAPEAVATQAEADQKPISKPKAFKGSAAAQRPTDAMAAATQSVFSLMDTLQSVSSPDQAEDARSQIESTIQALEEAQRAPQTQVGSGSEKRSELNQAFNSGSPRQAQRAPQRVLPEAASQVTPRPKIGRIQSTLAQAKAFVSGTPLLNSQSAASLLKMTPDEFSQLHAQGRVDGHIADSADGPLFDSGFMRPSQGVRSTARPIDSDGHWSEFDTAQAIGISPGSLKVLRESGQVSPQLDESFGIQRYQYSPDDRQALRQIVPETPSPETGSKPGGRSETSDSQPLSASNPASVPDLADGSETFPKPSGVPLNRPGILSRTWQGMKAKSSAWRQEATRLPGSRRAVIKSTQAASKPSVVGNAASFVANSVRQDQRMAEPTRTERVIHAAGETASRWFGPVASAAAGVNPSSSAKGGRASNSTVPPAADAGSRPPSVPDGGSNGPGGGNGGDAPPSEPPRNEPPDDDDEPERIRRRQAQRKSARQGGRRRRMFTAEQINALPSIHVRRMAHRANALTSIPRPSRKMQVMARRRARQAMGRLAKTRVGGAALKMAGRVTPMAGRAIAATMGSPVGGVITGAAGAAGMAAGGVALAAGLTGLAALITGTVTLAMKSFAEHINEGNRRLTQYNGSIAAAFGMLEVSKLQMGIKTARETQGSTVALAQRSARMDEALQPIDAAWTNVKNVGGVVAADAVTLIAETITETSSAVAGVASFIEQQTGFFAGMLVALEHIPLLGELAEKAREYLEEIADNTKKDKELPAFGTGLLQELEKQGKPVAPAKPLGPMPGLWEDGP